MSSKKLEIRYEGKEVVVLNKWKVRVGARIGQIGHLLFTYHVCNEGLEPIGETMRYKCKKVGIIVDSVTKKEGELVSPNDVVIEYTECLHNTVMKDLCADCGVNINALDANQRQRISELTSVSMVHSVPELRVSKERAETLGRADERRLLNDRKLVLLVDLDQTLIHSTNHNIPQDMPEVHHFQLYGPHTQWYHTKFRPNTIPFLQTMSKLFELHICTFGARRYAHAIAHLIDPKELYFPKDRILSRDECFDSTLKTGNMKSLFPCGDAMVCIIDDREDVWNFAPNLVAVKPYVCFRDTGDINAPERAVPDMYGNPDMPITDKTDVLKEFTKVEEIDEKVEEIDEKVEEIDEKVEEIDGKVEEIDEKVEEIDGKVEEIDEKVEEIDGKVEEIDGKVEEIDGKVEEIDEKVEEIDGKVEPMSEQIEDKPNFETQVNNENFEKEFESKQTDDSMSQKMGKIDIISDKTDEKYNEINKNEEKEVFAKYDSNISETVDPIDEKSDSKMIIEIDPKNSCDEKVMQTKSELDSKSSLNVITDSNADKTESLEKMDEMNVESKEVTEEEQKSVSDDSDDYLLYLEEILSRIHSNYYKEYDEKMKYSSEAEEIRIPDLKQIIPNVRKCVLRGVNIVFSGVIPTNIPPEKNKLYNIAKTFGATITPDLVLNGSPKTTHLIAAKWGTVKVNKCIKMKNIFIVSPNWLYCCAERWERVDERLYPLEREDMTQDKERSVGKQTLETNIQNQSVIRLAPKLPALPSIATYDPITGKRIRTENESQLKSESEMKPKTAGSQQMLEESRQMQPHNMLEFSPLSGFTRNELQSMGKEVDDACSEGDAMSTGNTDSDSDIDVEEDSKDENVKKCEKRPIDSTSSDESNDGECPKGWNKNKRSKKFVRRAAIDLEEVNDSTRDSYDFENRRTIDGIGEEDSTDNESVGSVDEEMALAVEREFLS